MQSYSPACVVQVSDTIGEPHAEMEEGGGWTAGHASVSISGTRDDILMQAEHRTHPRHLRRKRERTVKGGGGRG